MEKCQRYKIKTKYYSELSTSVYKFNWLPETLDYTFRICVPFNINLTFVNPSKKAYGFENYFKKIIR